jgi:hypothetical protein
VSQPETQALHELVDEVRGMRKDLEVFHTKMFGEPDSENAQGQLPRLEATVACHSARIPALEKRQAQRDWTSHLLSGMAGAILSIAAFFYYIHNLLKH